MGHRSFQCPENIDTRNVQTHIVNMVQDGSIDVRQLAEELATFAAESEDQLPANGIDPAAEETRNQIPDQKELYYT